MTSYAEIERDQTRGRLEEIKKALDNFPSDDDYKLGEITLIEMLQMADVANREVVLKFVDHSANVWHGI